MALAVTMLMGAQTVQAQDVLTPEQQAEMKAQADAAKAAQKEASKALKEQKAAEKAQKKKEAEARKNLKAVRKDMRKEIESLENNVMLVNIGLMPLLVVLGGIALAISKRIRSSAK